MRNKAIIILLIVLAATGYFFWYKPKFTHAIAANAGPAGVMEVGAMRVQKQNIQLFLELPARVSAYRIAEVRPQVDGVIKKQKFVEGSFVKEGQSLYQIDPAIYQAAYDGAWVNLKAARAKRDRYKNLLEEDAVSKQEFDDVEAVFALAQADFKKASTALNYSKVLAPISGYIGKSNVTEGALASVGQSAVLTTITQLDPIYVDMVEPSKDMVKFGDQKEIPVSLTIDGMQYNETGTLKFSEMFADENTDSVRLRSVFANSQQKLIPGMFVSAKLHLRPVEGIAVPQKATSRAPDGSLTIWVVEGDVAKTRVIKADQVSGDSWVVVEGLNDGDVVIYEGFQKVMDGMKVKPVFAVAENLAPNVAPVEASPEDEVQQPAQVDAATPANAVSVSTAPANSDPEKIPGQTTEEISVPQNSAEKAPERTSANPAPKAEEQKQ